MTLPTDTVSNRLRRLAQRLKGKVAEAESIGVCANQHDKIVNSLTIELATARRDCARYKQELAALSSSSNKTEGEMT